MPGRDPWARPRPLPRAPPASPRAPRSLSPAVHGSQQGREVVWVAPGSQHPAARPNAAPCPEDPEALALVLNRLLRAQREHELQQEAAGSTQGPATRDRQAQRQRRSEQRHSPAQGATPGYKVRDPDLELPPSSLANARARQVLQHCRAKAEALLWQLSLEQSAPLSQEVPQGWARAEQVEGQQLPARAQGPTGRRTLEMQRAGSLEQNWRSPRSWAEDEEEEDERAHVQAIKRKAQRLAQISGAAMAQACSARAPGLGLGQEQEPSQQQLRCEGDPGPAAGPAASEKRRGRRETRGHVVPVCNLITEH
ncbi:coiled-coil domain-containing protein 185 [Cavia porcellus]|uniref:coiled-coil domain-containing protein 185 n=1 Tax=Cavia porcellus TaxID=10141 RepID=UPI002FE1EF42